MNFARCEGFSHFFAAWACQNKSLIYVYVVVFKSCSANGEMICKTMIVCRKIPTFQVIIENFSRRVG